MERKAAIATAGAITMSVVSVLFAVGASSGALGSSTASSSTPAPAVTSASPTPTAVSTPAATSRAVSERHSDDQVRQSPSGAGARSESDD
jgi:hypothetical protein